MSNKIAFHQPLEVESVVVTVTTIIGPDEQVIVQRPDYNKQVGVGDNLWRTSLYLSKQDHPENIPVAHISNMPYDDGNTRVVVFATLADNTAKKTVSYQSPVYMMSKEHLVSNLGCRDNNHIAHDIAAYLLTGELPA